jgi:hypothetical protein
MIICIYNYLEDNCWECLTLYYLLAYVCMFWNQYWSVVLDHWHSILESWPFGVDRFEWSMPNLCGLIFDQLPIHHTHIYIVFYILIYTHVHIIHICIYTHSSWTHVLCIYIYIMHWMNIRAALSFDRRCARTRHCFANSGWRIDASGKIATSRMARRSDDPSGEEVCFLPLKIGN